jgi:hypothetical protein
MPTTTRNKKASTSSANITQNDEDSTGSSPATETLNNPTTHHRNIELRGTQPITASIITTPPRTTTPTMPTCDDPFDEDSSSNNSNAEDDNSEISYIYWDGTLPIAKHTIAKAMAKTSTKSQLQQTEKIYTFLQDNFSNKERLNTSSTMQPYLLHIPGTGQLRVVYGLSTALGINGFEESDIGEEEFLALQGEFIQDKILPTPIQLPSTLLQSQNVKVPTNTDIDRINGHTKQINKTSWFINKNIDHVEYTMSIAPIPAFLIYDCIGTDIEAPLLLERLTATAESNSSSSLQHARHYILNTLVKPTSKDAHVNLDATTFMKKPQPDAVRWGIKRLQHLIPTSTSPTPTPTPTTPISNTIPSNNSELINALKHLATATATVTPEKEPDTSKLGFSTTGFIKLLSMCGLTEAVADEIPTMWTQLSESKLTKTDKASIIREHLRSNIRYRGARVPPLKSLTKMIASHNFEGETTMSSLLSAVEGLSPFAVPFLSETEIDAHNELADAVDAASMTTVKDVSSNKLSAKVPQQFDGLVKHIQRYANLIFTAFGNQSPLLLALDEIIDALEEYNDTARSNMSVKTIAAILWVIMLQSRHFAAGKMEEPNAYLPAFTNMTNCIRIAAPVINGMVPTSLYISPTTTKRERQADSSPSAPASKKRKTDNVKSDIETVKRPEIYNAKMATAMKPFTTRERLPILGVLCSAARTRSNELFPSRKQLCLRAQLWGQCNNRCNFEHIKVQQDEIDRVLSLLKPVIDNPKLVDDKVRK